LLPRHWDWLERQRGAPSATLRRLVEDASRADAAADALRQGQDALYRFATVMAGDAPGYEAALRALYAGDEDRFVAETAGWPPDVRAHALDLADAAFGRSRSPLDPLVPAARRRDVRRVIEAALPGVAVEAAAPLTGGASGAGVFRLTADGRPYLLRLDGPPDGFRDPARQYACQRIAAEAGVAPMLIHGDPEARVSLSAFVEVAAPRSRTLQLTAAAEAVRRLHRAPLFPPLMPYLDAMDRLLADFAASEVLPASTLEAPLALYARLAAAYPRDAADVVSSHNDLNPRNILFDGERAVIVDWESAFAADRYVDLAALLNFFAADEAEETLILDAYFARPMRADERARAFLMRQVNRLFYAAMMLGAAAREQPGLRLDAARLATPRFAEARGEMASLTSQDGRIRFGCVFLNEATIGMESPAFEAALADL
jgi:aminoglycoside phosphotransferase (APT) family kinase protein